MPLYSNSRLNSHETCPRKFLWRYVWGVDPSVEGVEAFTGKRVHETLEDLYDGVIRGEDPLSLAVLLDIFQSRWDRAWHGDIRIVRDEPPSYYQEIGVACLQGYYSRHHPFRSGLTLGIEQSFEFPLEVDGRYRIRGFIDRIDVGPDGVLEIHDYKTGKRTPSARKVKEDLQVALYEMAARSLYPEHRRVRMVWHFLRSGREHRVEERDPAELAALRRGTARRIGAIEARIDSYAASLDQDADRTLQRAKDSRLPSVPLMAREKTHLFPPRVTPLCRWCSFLDWCPEGARHAGIPFQPPAPPPEPPLTTPEPTGDTHQLSLF
jgi:hypothetical protein